MFPTKSPLTLRQGISPHNIMINYAGHIIPAMKPLGEHLPVKYYLIDFGPSILLEESSGPLVPPLRLAPHRTSAPEVDSGDPFDPFAADVYQTAVFMLEHFYVGPRVAAFLPSR